MCVRIPGNMKNILVVENNEILASTLKKHLSSKGYFVSSCSSVENAINELEEFSYDLVILDRILDDGDGIEIAEFISDFSFQTKIIILSEVSNINERIKGLEKGADEYLTKPFSLTELTIKIQKLINTQKIKNIEKLSLGKISIIPETGELTMDGQSILIRKRESQLLACLIRYKNQVVSRKKRNIQ